LHLSCCGKMLQMAATSRASGQALIPLRLGEIGPLGQTVALHNLARVLVFGGITGEEVKVEVVRRYRTYVAACVREVIEPSPNRVEPTCPYFGRCTGCQWQHIRYEHQLELKHRIVRDALESYGGIPNPPVMRVVPAPQPLNYRNHARFTVGRGGALGFVNWQTRRFISVSQCQLMHPWINKALFRLHGHCGETTQLSIRVGVNTNQYMIQPALKHPGVPIESGQKHYEEELRGRRFRVSAASFFQVNTAQAERLTWLVQDRFALTGQELVVDAYAGVGTFAVLLAPFAKKVIAIEDSASAVQDAQANIQGLANVQLAQARTEDVLPSLPQADAMVLDPPRTGCHPRALQAIITHPPKRIVYVSCDPHALARDLRILLRGPFTLDEVLPVDLFPQTYHIECLATLSYSPDRDMGLQSRKQLVLASASPRRQQIMNDMGLAFSIVPSEAQEPPLPPSANVIVVARERATHKARAVAATFNCGTIIGVDTVVADESGILGKPASAEQAHAYLRRLRGKDHWVVTALTLIDAATGQEVSGYRTTRVRMRLYSDLEISNYVASGDCMDKAGAYAIQDKTFHPVEGLTGCYLNVVGLPACMLMRLLARLGIRPILNPKWKPPGNCPDCNRLAKYGRLL